MGCLTGLLVGDGPFAPDPGPRFGDRARALDCAVSGEISMGWLVGCITDTSSGATNSISFATNSMWFTTEDGVCLRDFFSFSFESDDEPDDEAQLVTVMTADA